MKLAQSNNCNMCRMAGFKAVRCFKRHMETFNQSINGSDS